MLNVMLQLEDQSILARRSGNEWRLEVQCGLTGESEKLCMSDGAFGAVLALMVAGDEVLPGDVTKALYAIAEPAMPKNKALRMIP